LDKCDLKYKKKLSGSESAQAISGIKFMFQKTLATDFKVFGIVKNPRGKKLPVILTREEVGKVLNSIRVLRHKACLTLIYTGNLRLHEAGIDIRIIQKYLGHKSISSTMIYTHLTPIISENVHGKVDRLMSELFK
jgi:site-specific recombinase XerD